MKAGKDRKIDIWRDRENEVTRKTERKKLDEKAAKEGGQEGEVRVSEQDKHRTGIRFSSCSCARRFNTKASLVFGFNFWRDGLRTLFLAFVIATFACGVLGWMCIICLIKLLGLLFNLRGDLRDLLQHWGCDEVKTIVPAELFNENSKTSYLKFS